jgi:hypothetical protein
MRPSAFFRAGTVSSSSLKMPDTSVRFVAGSISSPGNGWRDAHDRLDGECMPEAHGNSGRIRSQPEDIEGRIRRHIPGGFAATSRSMASRWYIGDKGCVVSVEAFSLLLRHGGCEERFYFVGFSDQNTPLNHQLVIFAISGESILFRAVAYANDDSSETVRYNLFLIINSYAFSLNDTKGPDFFCL